MPLEELHLSHNLISFTEALQLIRSACRREDYAMKSAAADGWMGRAVDSKGTSMNICIFEGKTGKSSRIGCESQAKLAFWHSRPEMSDVLLFCRDQTYLDNLDMNKSFNLGVPTSIRSIQSPSISIWWLSVAEENPCGCVWSVSK